MSEFRAALQALVDVLTKDRDLSAQRGYVWHIDHACNECTTDPVKWPSVPEGWRCAYHGAKALLARPERINRPETGDGFTQRMQAERLENASNRRYPAPPKDPQPGEYEPGDGAPPQSEPEPRITREEAEKLLRAYGYAVRLEQPLTEKFEACLAAMLRSEPDTFDPFGDVQRAHEAEEMVPVLGMLDADQTACSGAIRVRAFWSLDRKLLISAYVTRDSITLMDDDCHIYEPTGNEQVFTDAPSPPAASDGE